MNTGSKGARKGRLRKLFSGFLAVSTAVTMLSGNTAFLAGESGAEYALAGAGSGQDVTVHFGDGENQDINIHVNTVDDTQDVSRVETETEPAGKEAAVAEIVTISSVDGNTLPEEAEASGEILTGKKEEKAVEKVEAVLETEMTAEATLAGATSVAESGASLAGAASSTVAETGGTLQADTMTATGTGTSAASQTTSAANAEAEEGASLAGAGSTQESQVKTIEITEYQVFDIALDNVDENQYEEGFKVEVTLPEKVKGRDFRLYHIHKGEDPVDITDSLNLVSRPDRKTDMEVVSGFEFVTEKFSEFVLKYTVDFEYVDETTGEVHTWKFPGKGSHKIAEVLAQLGIEANTIAAAELKLTEAVGEYGEKDLYLTRDTDSEWWINSDAAFDDTYLLTVIADEKAYEITVTDAQENTHTVTISVEDGVDTSWLYIVFCQSAYYAAWWGYNNFYAFSPYSTETSTYECTELALNGSGDKINYNSGAPISVFLVKSDQNNDIKNIYNDANRKYEDGSLYDNHPVSIKTTGTNTNITIGDAALSAPAEPTYYTASITGYSGSGYYLLAKSDNEYKYFASLNDLNSVKDADGNQSTSMMDVNSFEIVRYTEEDPALSDLTGVSQKLGDGCTVYSGNKYYSIRFPIEADSENNYLFAAEEQAMAQVAVSFEDESQAVVEDVNLDGNYYIVASLNGDRAFYAPVTGNGVLSFKDVLGADVNQLPSGVGYNYELVKTTDAVSSLSELESVSGLSSFSTSEGEEYEFAPSAASMPWDNGTLWLHLPKKEQVMHAALRKAAGNGGKYTVNVQVRDKSGNSGSLPAASSGQYYLLATVHKLTDDGQKTYYYIKPLSEIVSNGSGSVEIESFRDPSNKDNQDMNYPYQSGDNVSVRLVVANDENIINGQGGIYNTQSIIENGMVLGDYNISIVDDAENGTTNIVATQSDGCAYSVRVLDASGQETLLDQNTQGQNWYVYAEVTRTDGVYCNAFSLAKGENQSIGTMYRATNSGDKTTVALASDFVSYSLRRPAGDVSNPAWKYFKDMDKVNVNATNGASVANKYTLEVNGNALVLREAGTPTITVSTAESDENADLALPRTDGAYYLIGEMGFRDGLEDKRAYSVYKLNGVGAYTANFNVVFKKGQYETQFSYQNGAAEEYLTGTRYYEPYIVFIPNDQANNNAGNLTDAEVVAQLNKIAYNHEVYYLPFKQDAVLGKYRVETTDGTLDTPDTTVTLNLLPGIQVSAQVKDADGNAANFDDNKNYYVLAEMNQDGVKSYAYTKLNFDSSSPEGTGASPLQNFKTDENGICYCSANDEVIFYMVESEGELADLDAVKAALRYSEGQLMSKYVPSFTRDGDNATVTLTERGSYVGVAQTVKIEMLNKAQTASMAPEPQLDANNYYVVAWLSAKGDERNQPVAWRVLTVDKNDLNADGQWETIVEDNDEFNICDSQLTATRRVLAGCDPDQYNLNLRMFSSNSEQNNWADLKANGSDASPRGYDFKGVFNAGKPDPNKPEETIGPNTSIIRLHQAYDNKEYGIRVYVDRAGLEIPEGGYLVRVWLHHESGGDTVAFAKLQVSADTGLTDPCELEFYTDSSNRIWRDNNGNLQDAVGNYAFTGNEKGVDLEILSLVNPNEAFGEWVKDPSQTKNYTLVKPGESINLYTPSIGERETEEVIDTNNPDNSKLCIYDVIRFTKDVNGVTIGELQNALSTATNFGLYTELLSKHATDMESNIGAAQVTCTMGADYGFTSNNTLVNELKVVKRWYGLDGKPAQGKNVELRLYPVETYDETTGEYTLADSYYQPATSNNQTDNQGVAQIVFNRLPAGRYVLKEVINGKEYAFNSTKTGDVIKTDDNKTSISFTDEIITVKNINVNVNYFGDIADGAGLWALIRHSRGGIIVTDNDEDYSRLVQQNAQMQGNEAGTIYKTGTSDYPTTYNIPADMDNLRALSRRLAADGSSETVKVMNVTAEELNNGDALEIKGDGRFVVVNVDMSNMGNVATVKVPTKFDGVTLEADFGQKGSEFASKVLFNFVSNGQPYTGKINTVGVGAGVLLAPSAIVADLGGNWGGTIICREAQHTGSEIHSDSQNKIQNINTVLTNSETELELGNLEIEKEFDSDDIFDRTTWFEFEVALTSDDMSRVAGKDFVATGLKEGTMIHFNNEGKATIQVRARNRVIITGLPVGTPYQIREVPTVETAHYQFKEFQVVNGEGTIESSDGSVNIVKNKTVKITAVNTTKKAGLTLKKVVEGTDKKDVGFHFRLYLWKNSETEGTFNAVTGTYSGYTFIDNEGDANVVYDGHPAGVTDIVLKNGDEIALDGIEEGIYYAFVEQSLSDNPDYQYSIQNEEGVVAGTVNGAVVTFYNTYVSHTDIHVLKVSSVDKTTPLSGAVFTLTKKTGGEGEGTTSTGDWVSSQVQTSNAVGMLEFKDLEDGFYRLKETHIPTGYNRISNGTYIYFTIADGVVTWIKDVSDAISDTTVSYKADEKTFTVTNTPGAILPATGGEGTRRIYLIGLMMIALAGAGFIMIRRRKGYLR